MLATNTKEPAPYKCIMYDRRPELCDAPTARLALAKLVQAKVVGVTVTTRCTALHEPHPKIFRRPWRNGQSADEKPPCRKVARADGVQVETLRPATINREGIVQAAKTKQATDRDGIAWASRSIAVVLGARREGLTHSMVPCGRR